MKGDGLAELEATDRSARDASAAPKETTGREVRTKDSRPLGVAASALFATAALAPLPFGSNDPLSLGVFCLVLAVGLLRADLTHVDGRRAAMLVWILGIATAYAFVLHEQMSSTPWIAKPNPIWARASAVLGVDLPATVSVMRFQPLYALGNTLACIVALCLSLVVASDRRRARQLLSVVAWSGAGYAVYGIVTALIAPNEILWLDRPGYVGDVIGTFVNRNTAATYFGCTGVVWLLLLLEATKARLPRGDLTYARFSKRVLQKPGRDVVVPFVGLSAELLALLMTGSRAGVAFSLLGMILAGCVELRGVIPRRFGAHWLLIGGAVIALMLLQLFGGAIGRRLETSGVSDEGRFDIYRAILHMIRDHPWFGTGLGTFASAFPAYREMPPDMTGVWTMGHSTPLEMAAELGIPLTAVVGVSALMAVVVLVRGAFHRRRDEIVPLAGATVLAISVAHSCIDFSLQIPGLAIVVMTLVGTGLAQSFSSLAHPPDRLGAPVSVKRSWLRPAKDLLQPGETDL